MVLWNCFSLHSTSTAISKSASIKIMALKVLVLGSIQTELHWICWVFFQWPLLHFNVYTYFKSKLCCNGLFLVFLAFYVTYVSIDGVPKGVKVKDFLLSLQAQNILSVQCLMLDDSLRMQHRCFWAGHHIIPNFINSSEMSCSSYSVKDSNWYALKMSQGHVLGENICLSQIFQFWASRIL